MIPLVKIGCPWIIQHESNCSQREVVWERGNVAYSFLRTLEVYFSKS